jgi:hypothetical protein
MYGTSRKGITVPRHCVCWCVTISEAEGKVSRHPWYVLDSNLSFHRVTRVFNSRPSAIPVGSDDNRAGLALSAVGRARLD